MLNVKDYILENEAIDWLGLSKPQLDCSSELKGAEIHEESLVSFASYNVLSAYL